MILIWVTEHAKSTTSNHRRHWPSASFAFKWRDFTLDAITYDSEHARVGPFKWMPPPVDARGTCLEKICHGIRFERIGPHDASELARMILVGLKYSIPFAYGASRGRNESPGSVCAALANIWAQRQLSASR